MLELCATMLQRFYTAAPLPNNLQLSTITPHLQISKSEDVQAWCQPILR